MADSEHGFLFYFEHKFKFLADSHYRKMCHSLHSEIMIRDPVVTDGLHWVSTRRDPSSDMKFFMNIVFSSNIAKGHYRLLVKFFYSQIFTWVLVHDLDAS